MQEALTAGTITIGGHGGDQIEAYLARPLDGGPHGSVVVVHHLPGYDAATKEIVRRFAARGYLAICPNLHHREAPGAEPDDAAAAVRAAGGVPDDRLLGDVAGAIEASRGTGAGNGKVGVIGYCSGGRQSFLVACNLPVDAAVDCYGACVVNPPPPGMRLNMPPLLDSAPRLSCPLLGLFGADDTFPAPAETAVLAAELERLGKPHEFHTYPETGHAFFAVDRPSYRPLAATDGWRRILEFFGRHLTA
jgi:carboxymethylenebutenolidase